MRSYADWPCSEVQDAAGVHPAKHTVGRLQQHLRPLSLQRVLTRFEIMMVFLTAYFMNVNIFLPKTSFSCIHILRCGGPSALSSLYLLCELT